MHLPEIVISGEAGGTFSMNRRCEARGGANGAYLDRLALSSWIY